MNIDAGETMKDQRSTATTPAPAQCVACKEDIRPGATVCTKCKTPQNWTRHIFDWKEVGSAVLALVPLWTGAVALWALAFREPEAKLRTALSACEAQSLSLALVNDGDAYAILSVPEVKLSRDGQVKPLAIVLKSEQTYPSLLGPKQGASVTLRPQVEGLLSPLPTRASEKEACVLVIETRFQGFKSKQDTASAACSCPSAS
jgi:hypothetical protein